MVIPEASWGHGVVGSWGEPEQAWRNLCCTLLWSMGAAKVSGRLPSHCSHSVDFLSQSLCTQTMCVCMLSEMWVLTTMSAGYALVQYWEVGLSSQCTLTMPEDDQMMLWQSVGVNPSWLFTYASALATSTTVTMNLLRPNSQDCWLSVHLSGEPKVPLSSIQGHTRKLTWFRLQHIDCRP